MAKIFEQWISEPFPGKVYLEIEDRVVKYGYAPAGFELSLLEFPVTEIYKDRADYLAGNDKLGLRIVWREPMTDHSARVKLQIRFPKIGSDTKTIWEDDVYW